jgi:PBSX family phage terminase large subunit
LGDFRKQEGLVYKEFQRNVHLVDEDPKEAEVTDYLAGIDFGYTNPAAIVHIKKDIRGNLWVVNEWYERGRTEDQIADYVRSCGFNAVYADPESPSAIATLNKKGVNVREVIKNKDSVVNGIQQVRELLKQNKLKIHQRCVNLIAEFEMYAYPDQKAGLNLKEIPVKENDHALDALRYVIMSSSPKPVDYQRRAFNYQERMRNIANVAR